MADAKSSVRQLFNMASTIVSRANLSNMLGQQFGGKRDVYDVLGYRKQLTFDDFHDKYIRQDIASRIVDAPASASWATPPIVRENDDPKKETKFEKAWTQLVKDLRIWHYMERVDKLAGLGRYAVLFIGFDAGKNLERPVVDAKGVNFLSVFSEKTACIKDLVEEVTNSRFGLPKQYTVDVSTDLSNVQNTQGNRSLSTKIIDNTRMIHVAEGLLENEIFGKPRLERVFNLLDDMIKVAGGSAEIFWQSADRGMQADIDKEMKFDADDEKALSAELDEYFHGLRRWVRTRGVSLSSLGGNVADPRGNFTVTISLIAGATGIPQRILLGSERGQLASGQDERSWAQRIKERQESFAEPMILRPFIDRLIEFKALPKPKDYEVVWPDLTSLGEQGKAEIAGKIAKAAKDIADQDERIITKAEFRKNWLDLPAENKDLKDGPIVPPTGEDDEETEETEDEGNEKAEGSEATGPSSEGN